MRYEPRNVALLCVIWSFYSTPVYTSPETTRNLNVVLEWKQLDYDYSSPAEKQADILAGRFNIGKLAPIDVDVYYSGRKPIIFLSIPRTIQNGVPASLGTVSDKRSNGNPLITPYPSWNWHRNLEQCRPNRIVSVFRMMIDECGRLWLLDTGKISESQSCPAQILAFDLRTNQLISRYEIPSSLLPCTSLLVTPVVEVIDKAKGCRNTFVYSADCEGFNILVYDLMRHTSWIVRDKTFYPNPDYGTYNISGESFELMDGVLGMSLTPNIERDNRRLFYHAMSSSTENWVYTAYLRNQTLFKDNPEAAPQIFHTYRNRRNTQSAAEAIDRNGILFYGLLGDIEIACSNTNGEYGSPVSSGIVGNNHLTMQFPSGMKIIDNQAGKQELWILTSRFQKATTGTLNSNEVNFRIMTATVDTLISDTSCRN